MMDLSKAYQALRTGKKEADLRLFLWRSSPKEEWKTYSYVCVNFGDQIAALCLELAKKITADKGRSLDELACQLLIEAMYVDNFLGGGSLDEVLRMKGTRLIKPGGEVSYSGTLARILSTTGFKTKALVIARNCTREEAGALGDKALGIPYNAYEDKFYVKLEPCITVDRKRGTKVVTRLQIEDLGKIRKGEARLTKRAVLSFLMGNFDPLGLLTPLIVKGKILLRRLYGPDFTLGWDDALPEDKLEPWLDLLDLAIKMEPIEFERAVRPEHARE